MSENLPVVSGENITMAPPYFSTAEGLLYEILMELGGPGQGGQLPFLEENITQMPPYTSTTEGLLYEILGALRTGGSGGGGAALTAEIKYGLLIDGVAVNPAVFSTLKIIKGVQQYYAIPAAVSNLAGQEGTPVRIYIVEPVTEPVKTSALWLRNGGSTFVREEIAEGNLMEMFVSGSNRIYRSQPIEAVFADGDNIGPIFLSATHELPLDFDVANNLVYNLQLLAGDNVDITDSTGVIFSENGPGNYNGHVNQESGIVTIDIACGAGNEMEIDVTDSTSGASIETTTLIGPANISIPIADGINQVNLFVRSI